MKQPSQKILVLKHLLRYGSITDKRARDSYGITRIAARVGELRKDKWSRWIFSADIATVDVRFTTRLGRRGRYAKYVISRDADWRRAFKHELGGK
jgi:hypothetical protein